MNRVNRILQNDLYRSKMQSLKAEESNRIFCRHGFDHLLSVARIMQILSYEQSMNIDKEIIYAAALLHDIGRYDAYAKGLDHAEASESIAEKILPNCGFSESETRQILFAVRHHNDEESADGLCRLLRKADKLSRSCFDCGAFDKCKWSDERKNMEIII